MDNILLFKPKTAKIDSFGGDFPENSAFCCPTCETCAWHLRFDYKAECQNGHVFDWIEWEIKEIDNGKCG